MKSFTVFALMSGVVASGLIPSGEATGLLGLGFGRNRGGLFSLGGGGGGGADVNVRASPLLNLNLGGGGGGSSSCNSCSNSGRSNSNSVNAQVGLPSVNVGVGSSPQVRSRSANVNVRANAPAVNVGLPNIGLGLPNIGLGLPNIGLGLPNIGLGLPSVDAGVDVSANRGGCSHDDSSSSEEDHSAAVNVNPRSVGLNVGANSPSLSRGGSASIRGNVAAPSVGVSVNGQNGGCNRGGCGDRSAGVSVDAGLPGLNVGVNSRSLGSNVGLNLGGLSLGLPGIGVSVNGDSSDSDESDNNNRRRRNRNSLFNLDINILNSRNGGRSERRKGLFNVKAGHHKVLKKNDGCLGISVPLLAAPAIDVALPSVDANVNVGNDIANMAPISVDAYRPPTRSLAQSSSSQSSTSITKNTQVAEQEFVELSGSASVEIKDMASAIEYWRQGQMDPALVDQINASVAKASDPQLADLLREALIEAINNEIKTAADSGDYN